VITWLELLAKTSGGVIAAISRKKPLRKSSDRAKLAIQLLVLTFLLIPSDVGIIMPKSGLGFDTS
jgi:hypothetical protein